MFPILNPACRYMVSMSVADHTGQAWLQGFNDVGIVVFGCPADDLIALQKTDETAYLSAISKAAANTYNFTCRAKVDSYNVSTRIAPVLFISPPFIRFFSFFLLIAESFCE